MKRSLLVVLSLAFALVLQGLACSTEDAEPVRPATFGAEISVDVLGPGRVQADVPGIDCPGACFARLVFPDGAARPAFTLTATPASPFVAFRGFRLEPDLVGSRGNGPGECSPIVRRATVPTFDATAATLILPLGEERGDPPPGKEKECAKHLAVPLAYRITAVFEDGSAPVVDAGSSGGPEAVVVVSALARGALARDLGLIGSRFYYVVDDGNRSSAVMADNGSAPTAFQEEASRIERFDVATNVVYQTQSGTLVVRRPSSGTVTFLQTGGTPCTAVTSDTNFAYCRRGDGRIDRFPIAPAPTPSTFAAPVGPDLAVDDSGSLYLSAASDGSIRRLELFGDGGVTSAVVASGQWPTRGVRLSAARIFWLEDVGQGRSRLRSTSKGTPGDVTTLLPSAEVQGAFVLDPQDPGAAYAVVLQADQKQAIVRLSPSTPVRTKLVTTGITSIAVDDQSIYFSSVDGRIYGIPRAD